MLVNPYRNVEERGFHLTVDLDGIRYTCDAGEFWVDRDPDGGYEAGSPVRALEDLYDRLEARPDLHVTRPNVLDQDPLRPYRGTPEGFDASRKLLWVIECLLGDRMGAVKYEN